MSGNTGGGRSCFKESQLKTVELLDQIRDGNQKAREVLCQKYLMPLQRWTSGRLPLWARGKMETDDLVQDVLLTSLAKIDQFQYQHSGCFQAYLRQSIKNRIRDEIRSESRRPKKDATAEDLLNQAPSPLEEIIGSQAMEAYEQGLKDLAPKDQEAIIARLELRFSYQEIATVLGLASPDAARMATKRAIKRLAGKMTDVG